MATKKTSKPAKKKAPAKKAAPKPKAAKSRPRTASPRSQVLPGMEQVTNRSLNRICEAIADVRADLNRIRGEEKDLMNQAVTVMTADKITVYRFSGVELVLVPGDVHLRVRTLKEKANTGTKSAEPEAEAPGATADEMADDEASDDGGASEHDGGDEA